MTRNLETQTIKKFRGMNLVTAASNLGPEWAQDTMNVIPSPSGGLEKLRRPVEKSTYQADLEGIGNMTNFQNAKGVRQIVAAVGDFLYYFTLDDYAATEIDEDTDIGSALFSFVQSNNQMFMANGVLMKKWDGTNYWEWGIAKPEAAPEVEAGSGSLDLETGRKYRFSYANSVTGHIGAASDASEDVGTMTGGSVEITIPPSDDPQVDSVFLYATMDGGADYYQVWNSDNETDGSWEISTSNLEITDETEDEDLVTSVIAPLINLPPTKGKYLTKYQGRIFVACLEDAEQDVIYSGYERILSGRPEESFPPNNRLRLAIGADEIRGMGALQQGVVFFSKSNEMFMLRGAPEDITVDEPIQYTAFLEQLPFSEGCASHLSIAETPYGLIWLGADKMIKSWNGSGSPVTLSGTIYPLLRSITDTELHNARGAFFNWLEKEWYLLGIPANGSENINRIVVIDLDPDEEANVGAFVLGVGVVDAMSVVEDSSGQRHLLILQDGIVKEVVLTSTTVNGLTESS